MNHAAVTPASSGCIRILLKAASMSSFTHNKSPSTVSLCIASKTISCKVGSDGFLYASFGIPALLARWSWMILPSSA